MRGAVKSLYAKYVTDKVKAVVMDEDLQKENTRQRDYLELTVYVQSGSVCYDLIVVKGNIRHAFLIPTLFNLGYWPSTKDAQR